MGTFPVSAGAAVITPQHRFTRAPQGSSQVFGEQGWFPDSPPRTHEVSWNISLLKQFTQPNQDSPVGYGTVYGTIRSFSSIHHVYRVPPVCRYQEREFGQHPQRYEAGEQS